MAKYERLTTKDIDKIADLWQNTNLSINAIARDMDVSHTTVQKYLHQRGYDTSIAKPTYWNSERLQYIIDHYKECNTYIAEYFGKGMTANSISHQKVMLRKKGLIPPVKHAKK